MVTWHATRAARDRYMNTPCSDNGMEWNQGEKSSKGKNFLSSMLWIGQKCSRLWYLPKSKQSWYTLYNEEHFLL